MLTFPCKRHRNVRAIPRMPGMRITRLAMLGYFLAGCMVSLKPDVAVLQSVSPAATTGPDCASCHGYPLNDVMHNYHLRALNPRSGMQAIFPYERKNGIIVCMDCHFGSVAHRSYTWYDTLWGVDPDLRNSADRLPGDPIYRIDSIPGFLPLPAGLSGPPATSDRVNALMDSAADIGSVVSWLTSYRHMDGEIDIEFSPNIVLDTSLSLKAYRPRDMSCSSIECHNAPKKTYRWASKGLGIAGCPTLEHTPALDSNCGYSTDQEPK